MYYGPFDANTILPTQLTINLRNKRHATWVATEIRLRYNARQHELRSHGCIPSLTLWGGQCPPEDPPKPPEPPRPRWSLRRDVIGKFSFVSRNESVVWRCKRRLPDFTKETKPYAPSPSGNIVQTSNGMETRMTTESVSKTPSMVIWVLETLDGRLLVSQVVHCPRSGGAPLWSDRWTVTTTRSSFGCKGPMIVWFLIVEGRSLDRTIESLPIFGICSGHATMSAYGLVLRWIRA